MAEQIYKEIYKYGYSDLRFAKLFIELIDNNFNIIKCKNKRYIYINREPYIYIEDDDHLNLKSVIQPTLLEFLNKKLDALNDDDEDDKINKIKMNKLLKLINKIETHSCIDNVRKSLDILYNVENDKYILDYKLDCINYKNGLLDLHDFSFRKRTKDDLISKILDYDYEIIDTQKEQEHINKIFLNIHNDDPKQLDFFLSFIAASLTGHKLSKFLFCHGSGGNGKSFCYDGLNNIFPIYVQKINSECIYLKNSSDIWRQIAKVRVPCKISYIDEVMSSAINVNLLKELSGSENLSCKVLYNTDEVIYKNVSTVTLLSNHVMSFRSEGESLNRRGLYIEFNNVFTKDDKKKHKPNAKIYKQDDTLLSLLLNDKKYKLGMLAILKPYFEYFYKSNSLKNELPFNDAFIQLNKDNDTFIDYIDKYYERSKDYKISKHDFLKHYEKIHHLSNLKITNVKDKLEENDLVYNCEKRYNKTKGVIIGIRLTNNFDDGIIEPKDTSFDDILNCLTNKSNNLTENEIKIIMEQCKKMLKPPEKKTIVNNSKGAEMKQKIIDYF
jgi:hypothetical protein